MRSDFEPKNLQRAKETLSKQLESVTSMHQELKVPEESKENKNTGSAFFQLLQAVKKIFQSR